MVVDTINIMLTHMLILIRGQFKYFQFDYFHRELIVNSFLEKVMKKLYSMEYILTVLQK